MARDDMRVIPGTVVCSGTK